MSLQVWLPLTENSDNKGVSDINAEVIGSGIIYTSGKIGNAATFPNNCSSYIRMPGFKYETNFSWACWFRCIGEGSSASQYILSEGRDYLYYGVNIWLNKAGTTLNVKIGHEGAEKRLSSAVELNKWYHVAIVFKDYTCFLYLNGIYVNKVAYDWLDYSNSNDSFIIGKMAYTYTQQDAYFPFNGKINDVRIYNHALTKKEVKEISSALTIHYTLDENNINLNENVVYDCSGYGNNAIASNITISDESPRYSSCSVFKSSSPSYIMTIDNSWMAQYAEEITVNVWAYEENWTSQTNTHLYSCTEAGGFNTEAGDSGYLRTAIYVATNAEHTTYTYHYDSKEFKISDLSSGWHMFTVVYTTEGHKNYIDGKLNHTYTNTNYGAKYNTAARLFLGCEASTANPGGAYFTGKESDFRLYYTALSDEDIKELYEHPVSADRNGNLYAYEFVEASS